MTSTVSFVLRCEQQCCIRSAFKFNSVAHARALRLSVSMAVVYSLHLFHALPRQFKLWNGKQAKSGMPERRKLKQALFEQIAVFVFKALRGMVPMYPQDLLQVKTLGHYSRNSDPLGLLKVSHTCMMQDHWRPAFAVAVLRFWNSRPLAYVRIWTLHPCMVLFLLCLNNMYMYLSKE